MENDELKPKDVTIWFKNGDHTIYFGCTEFIKGDDGIMFEDKYGTRSAFFKRNIAGFSMKDSRRSKIGSKMETF